MPGTDAAAAREREIVAAAASLFEQRGFHATSMEDIAHAVGIRKPTLYHYLRSKAEIVARIHDECIALLRPPLQGYLAQGLAPDVVLERVCADIIRMSATHPGYMRVYLEHHRELPPEDREQARRLRDEYTALVRGVVRDGVDRGSFATDDVSLTVLAFFGICNWSYQWFRPDGPRSADELAHELTRGFLDGLRVR